MPETRINTGFRHFNPVPGHTPLSSKGKIQYPHYPHIPLQNHTAKPSGTAAQFHSTFRSGNPDNPTSIASHITVSSYTATLSQCHFHSIVQSIPHTLQHQEISTFRSVTHALVVSQQTHAVMFRLLLFYTESCWIFLRDEIALPENWNSEFRYSEIAYFVLDDLSISVWILVKTLPHLRCVAVFTNVSTEIMIRYAQKRI